MGAPGVSLKASPASWKSPLASRAKFHSLPTNTAFSSRQRINQNHHTTTLLKGRKPLYYPMAPTIRRKPGKTEKLNLMSGSHACLQPSPSLPHLGLVLTFRADVSSIQAESTFPSRGARHRAVCWSMG